MGVDWRPAAARFRATVATVVLALSLAVASSGSAAPLSWSSPVLVDRGVPHAAISLGIGAVSCPSVSLCVAFDDLGNVLTSTTPAVVSSWRVMKLRGAPVGVFVCRRRSERRRAELDESNRRHSGVACRSRRRRQGSGRRGSAVEHLVPVGLALRPRRHRRRRYDFDEPERGSTRMVASAGGWHEFAERCRLSLSHVMRGRR